MCEEDNRVKTLSTTLLLALTLSATPAYTLQQKSTPKAAPQAKPVDTKVEAQSAPDVLHQLNSALQSLTQRVSPAIVEVLVSGYGPVSDRSASAVIARQRSLGSGVVLDPNGYIMTNAHVIEGAQRVQIVLTPRHDGKNVLGPTGATEIYEAKVLGADNLLDLALLKIEAKSLPYISLADIRNVRQGQMVVAIGSPQGLENTVTSGVVSSVARQANPELPMAYIQTDAAINPGNSGGALLDIDGHLVGINTFIYTQSGGSEGLGFAIPSSIVKFAYDSFRRKGHIDRPELGIGAQAVTPAMARALNLARNWGVIISDVLPEGMGAVAGLEIGDIIVSVDDKPIGSLPMLQTSLYAHPESQPAKVEVLRGKETIVIDVPVMTHMHRIDALADMPEPQEALVQRLGLYAIDVTEKVADLLGQVRAASGALVVARTVTPEAIETDIQAGDIIHAVNRTFVKNTAELRAALAQLKKGDPVVFQVERDMGIQFITSEVE